MKLFLLACCCALGWTMSACVRPDDLVAEVKPPRLPPLPPDPIPPDPMPPIPGMPQDAGCRAPESRMVWVSGDGMVQAVTDSGLEPLTSKPIDCLRSPLYGAAFDRDNRLWVNSQGNLSVVEANLAKCTSVWPKLGALDAISNSEDGNPLFGWESSTFVWLDYKAQVKKPSGQTISPGLVRSLGFDEKGRLLAMADRKDSVAIGAVNVRDGTFSPTWTVRPPTPQPFLGGIARAGKFELVFEGGMMIFDPATGDATKLKKLPRSPVMNLNEIVVIKQMCP